MTETNGQAGWAILYARVSTAAQVKGFSIRQRLAALREWAADGGYEVLEEISDEGESAEFLEREGLDRVRDLVEAGGVAVVAAQDADRITREPIHRALLDDELELHGARLVALDDWGDESHEGQLLRYMKGWVSKGERLKTRERTRRGLARKVREGKIIKGRKPPFGFVYAPDGEALVVDEPEMGAVRAIFRMVGVEGETLGGAAGRLASEGFPSPGGGRWHRTAVRHIVLSDLYYPRTAEEVADSGLLSREVARSLDTSGVYGQ